jgi:hypothetical protein
VEPVEPVDPAVPVDPDELPAPEDEPPPLPEELPLVVLEPLELLEPLEPPPETVWPAVMLTAPIVPANGVTMLAAPALELAWVSWA